MTQLTRIMARSIPMVLALGLGTGVLGLALTQPASAATKVKIDAAWTKYGRSRLSLSVGTARSVDSYRRSPRFAGWDYDRQFTANADRGDLTLTIDNGYQAQWVINDAYDDYYGTPAVVVDPRDNGDIYVSVTNDYGTREFMITEGGLGAMYSGGSIPVIVEPRHERFYLSIGTYRPDHRYVRPPAGVHVYSSHIWRSHDRDRDRVRVVTPRRGHDSQRDRSYHNDSRDRNDRNDRNDRSDRDGDRGGDHRDNGQRDGDHSDGAGHHDNH